MTKSLNSKKSRGGDKCPPSLSLTKELDNLRRYKMHSKALTAKFWVINAIAIFLVVTYIICIFMIGEVPVPLYQATPFQAMFMLSVIYLFSEGRLVHKVVVAKEVKQFDVLPEFNSVHKASKDRMDIPQLNRGDDLR